VSGVLRFGLRFGPPAHIAAVAPLIAESPLWCLCRSTGFVLLMLFTATVVLGQLTAGRVTSPRWPRFVTQSLHRNLALISVVFLIVHLVAPVIEHRLGLILVDAFVPFVPLKIRIWTRLASTSTDITLMVVTFTLFKVRAGRRFWRVVHLTSYVAWLCGVVHATGIGTDRAWVLGFDAVCVAMVTLSGVYRLTGSRRVALGDPARAL
jgi:sulfoxide reductase heme-binding subunit YedZ